MNNPTDTDILRDWYRFSAQQPGTVGEYLQLMRDRLQISEEQQRNDLGADLIQFERLQSIQLPRVNSYVDDAQRIAKSCKLSNPDKFVNIMLMARNLANSQGNVPKTIGYRAAFDAIDDISDEDL